MITALEAYYQKRLTECGAILQTNFRTIFFEGRPQKVPVSCSMKIGRNFDNLLRTGRRMFDDRERKETRCVRAYSLPGAKGL